jgi:O-antigen/teichoic acid export membrane protein
MLVCASAIGQGMLLIGTLVGARAFEPSAFGVLGVYVTLVVVFGMFSTGRLEAAIPIPRRDSRARDLLEAGMVLVPVVSLASYLFMETLAGPVLSWAGAEALHEQAWMVPAGTAVLGIRALSIGWATRRSFIRSLAVGRVANGGMTGIGFVIGAFAGADLNWLVGAWFVGQAAEMSVVTIGVMLDPAFRTPRQGARRRLRAIRRFQRFPRVLVWSHIMEQLGPHLPTTIIAGFYGTDIAGTYNIIYRVVARPAAIIGSSAHVMVTSEAAKRLRSGTDLIPLIDVGIRRLTGVGLALFMPMILGPRWEDAGMMLLAIIPGSAVDFVVVPLVPLLALVERIYTQLTLSTIRVAGLAAAIAASSAVGLGPIAMLVVLSAATIAIDALAITACRRGMKARTPIG